jgi:hypothetical protein
MRDEKPDQGRSEEPLLARWSRLKREAATPPPPAEVEPEKDTTPVALPPLESLTPDSDFSLFMQPQVDPELRHAALKKLFLDPRFNVMDGLDIYIDDYTRSDPIAPSIVAELAQFRNLGGLEPEAPPPDAPRADTPGESDGATAAKRLPELAADVATDAAGPVAGEATIRPGQTDEKSHRSQPARQSDPPETA